MISVVCGIILKNEKILITQRGDNKHLAGKWEFPGGKMEHGESEINSLKRELKEELNIEIEVFKRFLSTKHVYEKTAINLISYLARIASGKIQLNEHKNYKFVNKNDLYKYDFSPADLPIIEKLIKTNLKAFYQ